MTDLPLRCNLCGGSRVMCRAVRSEGSCPHADAAAMLDRMADVAVRDHLAIAAGEPYPTPHAAPWRKRRPDRETGHERGPPRWSPRDMEPQPSEVQTIDPGGMLDAIEAEHGREWAARVADVLHNDGERPPDPTIPATAKRPRRNRRDAWPYNRKVRRASQTGGAVGVY